MRNPTLRNFYDIINSRNITFFSFFISQTREFCSNAYEIVGIEGLTQDENKRETLTAHVYTATGLFNFRLLHSYQAKK